MKSSAILLGFFFAIFATNYLRFLIYIYVKEISKVKTGLGLHLIRDLAKAIECKITVNSEIGKGTKFTLELKR